MATQPRIAFNVELPPDGTVPEWVELIPSGPDVAGRDGRHWRNDQPDAIVTAFQAHRGPLVIDWEHASELRARQGQDAPAAGWITAVENRAGALWGKVDWTARARAQLEGREYRFLSPVFLFDRKTRTIQQLLSAGLTNQPNLHLTALNHEEPPMALPVALCQALGLADAASEAEALAAIVRLKTNLETAQNRAQPPDLTNFVPRADYDQAINRASAAEQQLQQQRQAQRDAAIDQAIQEALAAGKIAPASVDYHKANCQAEGGLERFQAYIQSAPALVGDSGLGDKRPPAADSKALNTETRQVAAMMGNTPDDIAQFGRP